MVADDFDIAIERREGETAVVLAGELDLYRAPEIERALIEAIEPWLDPERRPEEALPLEDGGRRAEHGVHTLVVDLQAVTFLDSTVLGLLLAANRRQRTVGGELLILVGPKTPTTAFEVTGFDQLLSVRHADALREEDDGPTFSRSAEEAARTRAVSAALTPPTIASDSK